MFQKVTLKLYHDEQINVEIHSGFSTRTTSTKFAYQSTSIAMCQSLVKTNYQQKTCSDLWQLAKKEDKTGIVTF